jgi:hypothetical protein
MKTAPFITVAALALLPALASAQVHINEIYASHSGTDNLEYIELVGTPGASLTGYLVLIVEGDGAAAGTIDRVWDLSGLTVPVDGYFVLGDTAEPAKDFDIGVSDRIENGTETFYLVFTATPASVTALLNTAGDPDGDLITTIGGVSTIVDLVGLADGGITTGTDKVYDGAEVIGPDQKSFLPAGIYTGADVAGDW